MIVSFIQNILIFIFVFITSFLIHELMHIKGNGLLTKGRIYVDELGMTVSSNYVINDTWFRLSGGIITSFIMFILVFCSVGWWQWCFLTMGYIQLCYGLYEGFIGTRYRYILYVTVLCVMLLVWMVK